jgi:pyruvate dehydrogenase (quinone)
MLGLEAFEVRSPDEVGPAWDKALAADRPTLIDAWVDPNVPTLPPHITAAQAKSYVRALMKGDPDARAMIWQSFKRGTV